MLRCLAYSAGKRSGSSAVVQALQAAITAAYSARVPVPILHAAAPQSGSDAQLPQQQHEHGAEQHQRSASPLQLLNSQLQTDQQQLPLFPRQLLQQLHQLHQLHTYDHNNVSSVSNNVTAQQLQEQEQQQQGLFTSPYQQAAVEATVAGIATAKQRLNIRLPPSAPINPVILQLVLHYHKTHGVLVLASNSDRALALKALLKPLLEPAGISPRLIPGELIRHQHTVVIVDLQQLQRVPSAAIQLQQQQQSVHKGLAIFEEGFMEHQEEAQPSSSSSSNSSESYRLYDDARRSTADRLLRSLGYLEPDPSKLLVTLSSRGWSAALTQQQQQQQQRHGGELQQLLEYELSGLEIAAAGLIRPISTVSISTDTQIPQHLLTASSSSSGSSSSHSRDELCQILSSNSRTRLIAAALTAVAGSSGKGVMYAAGDTHARNLAVALNLQGVSSLMLLNEQDPETQAAVLREFNTGSDRVLVTGFAGDKAASLRLHPAAAGVSCVLMAAPVFDVEEYAARLAPVLLPAAAAAAAVHGSSAEDRRRCIVVDLVDQVAAGAAADTQQQQQQQQSRRRHSSKAASSAVAGDSSASSAAAAAAAGSSIIQPLQCTDVLGSICSPMPLPPALAAAITNSSSSSSSSSSSNAAACSLLLPAAQQHQDSAATAAAASQPQQQQQQQQRIQGDLIWTILDDGSWAIPLKRGRGTSLSGMRILWLSRVQRGWIPQMEEGLGQMVPLPGTTGKPVNLQRARTVAESWIKTHHPAEAALRELGLEWRERPMTEAQVMFCDKHTIPYDPSWTRGAVNNTIDRYIVEKMHEPTTEKQLFLVKHFSPFAPSIMTTHSSSSTACKTAADNLLQILMVGDFAAAAAAVIVGRGNKRSGKAGSGSGSSSDGVLPSRQALLQDLQSFWDAGLRPKYTWMVLDNSELVLDLMSGSYLWLRPHAAAASNSSSSSSATALNPSQLYHLSLQLPDGSFHPVSTPAAAAALIAYHSTINPTTAAAAAAAGSSRPLPLPLATALDRAEKVAGSLGSQQHAFFGREVMRIAGMVGGWKVPPKTSEVHVASPASARQLEALRAHGVPFNRRYTCVDAHRELVRLFKTQGLPEPSATPTQLARIRELQLPLSAAAAARLTSAEARAMLFRVQLAEERLAAAAEAQARGLKRRKQKEPHMPRPRRQRRV